MRTAFRHGVTLFLFSFALKLLLQMGEPRAEVALPKAVLLSQLQAHEPIPARGFDELKILKSIQLSERASKSGLVNSKGGRAHR